MHLYTHTYIYIYILLIHMCMYMYTFMFTYIHIYNTHTYIYTVYTKYVHICMHIYILITLKFDTGGTKRSGTCRILHPLRPRRGSHTADHGPVSLQSRMFRRRNKQMWHGISRTRRYHGCHLA